MAVAELKTLPLNNLHSERVHQAFGYIRLDLLLNLSLKFYD